MRRIRERSMRVAMLFALVSAVSMMLGLLRWPSVHWTLAQAYLGVFTAVAWLVGMFRNVTDIVDPIAAINNYLLPLWMIVFGASLVRYPSSIPETIHQPI